MKELRERENGNFSFNSGLIVGCKQYSLRKSIEIDDEMHVIEINKCKGYSQKKNKLRYEDMREMAEGNTIRQDQDQFRCPKSNYVSETNYCEIRTVKVNKSFRMNYTKGIVNKETGEITPLII